MIFNTIQKFGVICIFIFLFHSDALNDLDALKIVWTPNILTVVYKITTLIKQDFDMSKRVFLNITEHVIFSMT